MNPHEASRGASWSSTYAAAVFDRVWVAWATWRAFHGSTARCSTSRQILGSRCWRSRASAISFIPVNVDTPSAAATGSGANADTAGVPSPPSDSSTFSTPGRESPAQVATPVSAVAGCSTHHCAASRSLDRSASRAAVFFSSSRARSQSASRSSTTTGCPIASTSSMDQSKHRAPTVRPRKARG